jgi:hypothetical protein
MSGQAQIYSNELNAFRSGVSDRIEQHRDKVDVLNKALGLKTDKLFEQSKKLADSSQKLIESGIGGSVGGIPLSQAARKGINSFKQILSNRRTQAAKILKGKANDLVKQVKARVGVPEEKEGEGTTPGEGGAVQEVGGDSTNVQEQQTGDTIEPRSLEQNTQYEYAGDQAKAIRIRDAGGEGGEEKGNDGPPPSEELGEDAQGDGVEMGNFYGGNPNSSHEDIAKRIAKQYEDTDPRDELTTDDINTPVGEVADTADDLASKAASSASKALGDAVPNVLEDAGAGGADAAGVGLEEAAGATSFLAWLGIPEALAAAGAISGAVGAGIGISQAVQSGADSTKAEGMPSAVHAPAAQLAGTYVVPTRDSIS